MTEQEVKELINKLRVFIGDEVGWFLMLRDKQKTIFLGDLCPRCAIDEAIEWAEVNDIQHNQNETIQ